MKSHYNNRPQEVDLEGAAKYLGHIDKIFESNQNRLNKELAEKTTIEVRDEMEYQIHRNPESIEHRVFHKLLDFGLPVRLSDPIRSLTLLKGLKNKSNHNGSESEFLKYLEKIFVTDMLSKMEMSGDAVYILLGVLIENLPEGISIKDKNLKYLMMNTKEAARINVADSTAVFGKSDQDLTGIDSEEIDAIDKMVMEKGQSISYEHRQGENMRNMTCYQITKMPFKDFNKDKTLGVITVFQDVTAAIKEREELDRHLSDLQVERDDVERMAGEMNLLNIEIEEGRAEMEKMFSVIGHDLRNPASTFSNSLEFLVDEYDNLEDTDRETLIKNAHKSSVKVLNLLLDLLEWQKIRRGLVEYKNEELKLQDMFDDVRDLYEDMMKKKGITFITKSSDQIMFTDKYMLNTVLRNLVGNAIKFTGKGGEIHVYDYFSNGDHNIVVKDTGVGMDVKKIDEIFRVDKSTSTLGTNNEPGTGLGLPMCKELVENIGGKIEVESSLGEGTKFTFSIPRKVKESVLQKN